MNYPWTKLTDWKKVMILYSIVPAATTNCYILTSLDAHTISKIGNVCFVKSTYHVKVQNTTVQPPPAKKTTAEKMIVAQPGVKLNSPQQKGATNTTTNSQQQKSTTNTTTNSQQSKNFQLQTVLKPSTNLHPALMDLPSTSAATKKVVTSQTKYPEVNAPSTSSATPVVTLSKKTTQVSAEDVKNISKSIPSLAVVVRPSKTLSELVMQKKRDELGTFFFKTFFKHFKNVYY